MEQDKMWDTICESKQMSLEEAEDIVDKMYQDRMSQIQKGDTIYVNLLDDTKFTNLEFASVILLREVQLLQSKLDKCVSLDEIQKTVNTLTKYYKEHTGDDKVVTQVMSLQILTSLLPEEGE